MSKKLLLNPYIRSSIQHTLIIRSFSCAHVTSPADFLFSCNDDTNRCVLPVPFVRVPYIIETVLVETLRTYSYPKSIRTLRRSRF